MKVRKYVSIFLIETQSQMFVNVCPKKIPLKNFLKRFKNLENLKKKCNYQYCYC